MAKQDLQTVEAEKAKLERELSRMKAQLAGRDDLLRRIRSEQQWSAEALASLHVPLLAFNGKGDLFWLNEAALKLLGLKTAPSETRTQDLPQGFRGLLEERLATATGENRTLEAPLKLHGQGYRVSLQFLAMGSAARTLNVHSRSVRDEQWLVSVVPEHGDIIAQELGYPDLPEVSMGEDGGGAVELSLPVGESSLGITLQPVLGLAQFLGTEQLARISYEAVPSANLDLALVNALAERIISDRLGALRAGAWMLRLSSESLHDRDFANRLINVFNRYQISGNRFVFGLPEAEVMDALVLMRQLQADLAPTGLRWALLETTADLGNFEYLAPLGLDFYCINPDLVAQAAQQERAKKVLHGLHEAASGQGMATLATGVDTPDAMTAIRTAGVDYASGRWATHESTVL
ncbi:MAG: EAL domain-containing protein [Gammaproteobacteria bacterium]|nr:EAL domain-containing protein [Gammaproteobacteria bacterium]